MDTINKLITPKVIIPTIIVLSIILWSIIYYNYTNIVEVDTSVPLEIGEIEYTYKIQRPPNFEHDYYIEVSLGDAVITYNYFIYAPDIDEYTVEVLVVYETDTETYYEIVFSAYIFENNEPELFWMSSYSRHFIKEVDGNHTYIDKLSLTSEYDFLIDIMNDDAHHVPLNYYFTEYDNYRSHNYID